MNIIRNIYSGGVKMGTFKLIQDLEFGKDYFWIQVPPCEAIILNKDIAWFYGESCRYIFDESDLKEE